MVLWTRSFIRKLSVTQNRKTRVFGQEEAYEEQIYGPCARRRAAAERPTAAQKHGISEATFYIWKKKYSGPSLSKLRELRQLRPQHFKLTLRRDERAFTR
jgi:hypothetical protein